MANAWHVHFEPTVVHLKPDGKGGFGATTATPGTRINPPAGSFPVVTAVRVKLTDDAQGPPPMQPGGASLPATLEFIGRAKPATPTGASPFISIGTVNGKVTYNTSGSKPVPQFICGTRKVPGGGVLVVLDFTPGTAREIERSDWVMRIEKHPDTFDTSIDSSFFVKLPWQFIVNPGRIQLSARLRVNGNLAADENRNLPLDIPIKHESVPEEADPTKLIFTFFGVRNLYTQVNTKQPSARVPLGKKTLNVILHSSFTDFCARSTSAKTADVTSRVADILQDGGFNPVNFLSGPPADIECNLHWKQVSGHFIARKITDPNQSQPEAARLEFRFAAAISANNPGSVSIPAGMEEQIPFFDFFVFAEDTTAPTAIELAHSEILVPVTGSVGGVFPATAEKAVAAPIVMATASSSRLRQMLVQIDPADHANLLATTICHEIGHTFGLRHAVAFLDNPPYQTGDAQFGRGVMGAAGLVLGLGTPRIPLSFFGPVHVPEIKRLFL